MGKDKRRKADPMLCRSRTGSLRIQVWKHSDGIFSNQENDSSELPWFYFKGKFKVIHKREQNELHVEIAAMKWTPEAAGLEQCMCGHAQKSERQKERQRLRDRDSKTMPVCVWDLLAKEREYLFPQKMKWKFPWNRRQCYCYWGKYSFMLGECSPVTFTLLW